MPNSVTAILAGQRTVAVAEPEAALLPGERASRHVVAAARVVLATRIQAGGVRIAFGVLQARLRQVFRFRETRGGFAVLRLAFVAVAQRRGHGAGQVLGTGARLAVIVGTAARRVHHPARARAARSEEHTSELQSRENL